MGWFSRKKKEKAEAEAWAQRETERMRQQMAMAREQQQRSAAPAPAPVPPPAPAVPKPSKAPLSPAAAALAQKHFHQYTSDIATIHKLPVKEFYPLPERFVVFDLETTGLDPAMDEIVEIGAVRVERGEITASYQALVNPGRPMPATASAVNGITDEMLAGKPPLSEVLPFFVDFVGDDIAAGHNVIFDARFLLNACFARKLKAPARYFDTMALAEVWDAQDKKLASLIRRAGIKNDAAHRALGDARATAELILKTPQHMEEKRAAEKQAKERAKLERAAAAEAFELRDDDRMLYATRCGLPSIKNAHNPDKGYQLGNPAYNVANELQKVGRLDDALIMLNKARALGYDAPALYECYALVYRKKKDYVQEIAMIDEFLSRNTYGKRAKFEERRAKAQALMEKARG